jgi:hypothetical protein
MPFRFRRSTRLGPLRFNFAKSGLSSISVGGRGASYNILVGRQGGARTTVGLPGTGMSWSMQEARQQKLIQYLSCFRPITRAIACSTDPHHEGGSGSLCCQGS